MTENYPRTAGTLRAVVLLDYFNYMPVLTILLAQSAPHQSLIISNHLPHSQLPTPNPQPRTPTSPNCKFSGPVHTTPKLFVSKNHPLDALELPWKFGDNRPIHSRVMSGQTDRRTNCLIYIDVRHRPKCLQVSTIISYVHFWGISFSLYLSNDIK